MKNLKLIHSLAMIIGLISIAFGIYAGINGSSFGNYAIKLLIGFSLFGVGYINNFLSSTEIKKENKEQIAHHI